jgi:LysR family hydrogen peroxide-inducible transcriptional activator
MEFHQLRYFLAVARTGSFGRAAEEEGITQPSLSQQIKKLEQELGVQLFDRLGRGVRLSRYGEGLLAEAERVMLDANRLRRALDALKPADRGRLSVGVIPTVLPYALAPALAAFRQAYPEAELDIQEHRTERLLQLLRAADIDIAVVALPVRQPEIVCSELYREPLAAALPSGHPLSGKPTVAVAELRDERLLLMREGHCLRDDVLTACSRAKVPFHQVFESDSLASIFSMVAAGFGISLVPTLAKPQGEGCEVRPLAPPSYRRIGYIQAAGHTSLPVQRTFVRFLRQWRWLEK